MRGKMRVKMTPPHPKPFPTAPHTSINIPETVHSQSGRPYGEYMYVYFFRHIAHLRIRRSVL